MTYSEKVAQINQKYKSPATIKKYLTQSAIQYAHGKRQWSK